MSAPLPAHRAVLVHWMRSVCAMQQYTPGTLFASTCILDRFLRADVPDAPASQRDMQLLALTCVILAAKGEQQQSSCDLLKLASVDGKPYQVMSARAALLQPRPRAATPVAARPRRAPETHPRRRLHTRNHKSALLLVR